MHIEVGNGLPIFRFSVKGIVFNIAYAVLSGHIDPDILFFQCLRNAAKGLGKAGVLGYQAVDQQMGYLV